MTRVFLRALDANASHLSPTPFCLFGLTMLRQDNSEQFTHAQSNECFIVSIYIDAGIILNIFNIAFQYQGGINTIIEQNIQRPPGIIAVQCWR